MGAKFYAIKGPDFLPQASYFGPFYPMSFPTSLPAQNENARQAFLFRNGAGQQADVRAGRYGKWPGVYSPPQPARGYFTAASFAGTTDRSTFTLDDGVNPPAVFQFLKVGVVTPGDIAVDISVAVTPADVAAAIVLAVNTYTNGLADPLGGFFASAPQTSGKPAGFVMFVQTGAGTNIVNISRGGWAGATYGENGNTAIVLGVGTGITAVHDFNGGTRGAPGIFAQFVYPGHPWVVCEGGYVAVPKIEIR